MSSQVNFLHLPPEIRIIIYEKYLIDGECIRPYEVKIKAADLYTHGLKSHIMTRVPEWHSNQLINPLPLFLCNRTIHHEASRVFYKENLFWFEIGKGTPGWWYLCRWLVQIGPRYRSLITAIGICYVHPDHKMGRRILRAVGDGEPAPTLSGEYGKHNEDIDPTIDLAFELLATRATGSTLTIALTLPYFQLHDRMPRSDADDSKIPQSEDTYYDSDNDGLSVKGMSLREYRKWIRNHAISSYWAAMLVPYYWERRKNRLEAHGWEVLSTKYDISRPPVTIAEVVVKKKGY